MSRSTRYAALLWGVAGLVGLILMEDAEACRRARCCQTYVQCGGCLVPSWVRCKDTHDDRMATLTCIPPQKCYCCGGGWQYCTANCDPGTQVCWNGMPPFSCPDYHRLMLASPAATYCLCAMVADPCTRRVRFAYPGEPEHGWAGLWALGLPF